ncbi:MAG: hypothetical protein RIR51_731 [Bacteroidota bacterium]|jgi:Fe(3+) dicitrate transport protein
MKKYLIIALLLSLFNIEIFAQNIEIQVFNNDSTQIEFPYIQIKGSLKGFLGDENGIISIPKNSLKFPLSLNIGAMGFETSTLEVSQLSQIPHKIQLIPNFKLLNEVIIKASPGVKGPDLMQELEGTMLVAGKKAERIEIAKMDINLGNQNLREVFSKNPGMNIMESDPSNLNTSISIRGLSTNRSWDFNNRLNGHDFTPDPLGYNEAYFTPTAEILERIDIIRGAASLQYGPQIGGLINYVLEKPNFSEKLNGQISQSLGSFGLSSTFGKLRVGNEKWAVIASHQYRKGDGFRPNSNFNSNQSYFLVKRKINKHSDLSFELTYADALAQQPGGLTQKQFDQDIQISNRSRNWFTYNWLMPTLRYSFQIDDKINLEWQAYTVKSGRVYLGFNQGNAIEDINDPINGYANRAFSRDEYATNGSELRISGKSNILGSKFLWVGGAKFLQSNIIKNQNAVGTNSTVYDETILTPAAGNLNFTNNNFALFFESNIHLTNKLNWTLGLRNENIHFSAFRNNFNSTNESRFDFPEKIRSILLYGTGLNLQIAEGLSITSNFNKTFKPITNSQLAPSNTDLIVDPNLQDAFAHVFDFGIKGKLKNYLRYDINYFNMKYFNQVGTITQANGSLFQTNLGNSLTDGLEAYIEYDPVTAWWGRSRFGYISLFTSLGLTNARYQDYQLSNGTNLAGNRIEYAPNTILRSGFTYSLNRFSITYLLNYVSSSFADAANTELANETATVGLIPEYTVQDLSFTYKFNKHFILKGSVSNLSDQKYFNKRNRGGTSGEGILPASPRNFSLGLSYKL